MTNFLFSSWQQSHVGVLTVSSQTLKTKNRLSIEGSAVRDITADQSTSARAYDRVMVCVFGYNLMDTVLC